MGRYGLRFYENGSYINYPAIGINFGLNFSQGRSQKCITLSKTLKLKQIIYIYTYICIYICIPVWGLALGSLPSSWSHGRRSGMRATAPHKMTIPQTVLTVGVLTVLLRDPLEGFRRRSPLPRRETFSSAAEQNPSFLHIIIDLTLTNTQ